MSSALGAMQGFGIATLDEFSFEKPICISPDDCSKQVFTISSPLGNEEF